MCVHAVMQNCYRKKKKKKKKKKNCGSLPFLGLDDLVAPILGLAPRWRCLVRFRLPAHRAAHWIMNSQRDNLGLQVDQTDYFLQW